MSDESPNAAPVAPENAETLLATRLREEVREAVRQALHEDEFLRKLGAQMGRTSGAEAAGARAGVSRGGAEGQTGGVLAVLAILEDASAKLDQILQTTERSATEIIELVERRLAAHGEIVELARACPDPELRGRMLGMLDGQHADLMRIMTCLSFQDLTAQRVKRVMDSLAKARDAARGRGDRAGANGTPPPGEAAVRTDSRADPDAPRAAREASHDVASQDEVDALLGRLGM